MLDHILSDAAAKWPHKTALVCEGRRLTYLEIDTAVSRLATSLCDRGIQRGDRVAIHLGNSAEAVISIFAVLRAGGVFVAINQTVKPDKLVSMLQHSGAKGLIHRAAAMTDDFGQRLQSEAKNLAVIITAGKQGVSQPAVVLDFDSLVGADVALTPLKRGIDLDLACLIYTSGSTGQPKAVMCDHSAMLFALDAIGDYLGNNECDVVLSVLPLSYSYGLYQLLVMFRVGGTLVLENSFSFPAMILQKMEAEQVTGFPGVPTMYSMMTRLDLSQYNLSSLRYMTNAAAALAPAYLVEMCRKLPSVAFFSMHGLTEVARTVFLDPQKVDRKPASVGQAMPGTEIWLEDESGRRVGPGETGEMVIRGRNVMRGYWNDPAGSADRFRPGHLPGERLCYSGDLFRMDEEGDLYFVSRKDDIIKTRGEKVSPKEIEDVLCSMAGVLEAAVVGIPDPVLGQAIKAIVVRDGTPLTPAQLLSYCRAKLEDHMIPRQIEFRDELPKTASGKIVKRNLG